MTNTFTMSGGETVDCNEGDGLLLEFIEHPDTTGLSTIKD